MRPGADPASGSEGLGFPMGWICDALGRDRSHVAVLCVGSHVRSAEFAALLSRQRPRGFEVWLASSRELESDDGDADRTALVGTRLETGLRERLETMRGRDVGLVLAIRDADRIPAGALRRLGGLTRTSGQGLRLAFFVDCAPTAVDTVTAHLVRGLGVGVEKIVVGLRAGEGAPRPDARACQRSAVEDRPGSAPEADRGWAAGTGIRVRRRGQRTPRRIGSWAALVGAAALLMAWGWSAQRERTSDPAPARKAPIRLAPTREALTVAVVMAPIPSPDLDRLREAPSSPDGASDSSAPATEVAESERAPNAAGETTPAARSVPVNLNAAPWAHVEVDGESIGTTPLADHPMDLGVHRFVLRFPDGEIVERRIEVDAATRYLRFP